MEIDYASLPVPEEPLGSRSSARGVVKWSRDNGSGCIACEATAPWDIWYFVSMVESEGTRFLKEGTEVSVDYERADQDGFRYRATRVRAISRGADRPQRS